MVSPVRVAVSIIAAFGGAVLAPLLVYLGFSIPFPATALGLAVVVIVPALLCRSFTTASTASIAGILAGLITWLTLIYNAVTDSLIQMVSSTLSLDPVLTYIILMAVMAPVSGALGLALPSGEKAVIRATLEHGAEEEAAEAAPAAEDEKKLEERVAEAEGVEEEVYVKCPHCGEPVPEEAVFCPSCGRKVKL
ncbi:MAG: zinc ribbon domain-containing protein [Nitrososphaerota archaeon]